VPDWETIIRAQIAAERDMYLGILKNDKAA
jgi:hypothetical protein